MSLNRVKLILIVLLMPLSLFAQNKEQLGALLSNGAPLTPNLTNIERYGNYEVSMFTGLPNINIPLYTISVGDLQVPISLSYHAAGIRVNDTGSWVGTGWTLNAGYSISRQVRGLPDELLNNYLSGNTPVKTTINLSSSDDITYMRDRHRGIQDVEPDLFSYNLPNKRGQFVFNCNDSYKPVIIPYAPIEINRTPISFPAGMNLTILDDDGSKYEFFEKEVTRGMDDVSAYNSSWLVSKISAVNQFDQISFLYSTVKSAQYDIADYEMVEDYGRVLQKTLNNSTTAEPKWYTNYNHTNISKTITTSTEEKFLQEINFRTGKVVFFTALREDRSPSTPLLSSIIIYDVNNIQVRKVKFNYSYFIKNGDPETKRLKLDNINIQDRNSTSVLTYTFAYNTSRLLPSRLSRGRDYWGYYNNLDNNTTLIPGMNVDYIPVSGGLGPTFHVGGNTNGREPNPDYMQACVLNKITYPTGGFTEFTYETNQYKTLNGVIKYAGGLRVSSIQDFENATAIPVTKTYKYGTVQEPNSGCGEANFYLDGNYYRTEQTLRYFYGNGGYDNFCFGTQAKRVRNFISSPLMPLDPTDGSPVQYPFVTEYMGTETTNVGKTEYTYRFVKDPISSFSTLISTKPQTTSLQFARGQLEKKLDYSNGIVIKSLENVYEAFPRNIIENLGFSVYKKKINLFENSAWGPYIEGECIGNPEQSDKYSYDYGNYGVITGDDKLVKSTEKIYGVGQSAPPLTKITQYSYNNVLHMQPSKIEIEAGGTNEKSITEIKYPSDFSTVNPIGDAWKGLVSLQKKHILNRPIEKSTFKFSLTNSNKRLLSSNLFYYNPISPVLDSIAIIRTATPLSDFIPAATINNSFEKDVRYKSEVFFDNYDAEYQLLQQHSLKGANKSYIWAGSHKLIAEANNCDSKDIFHENFEYLWLGTGEQSALNDSRSGLYSKIGGFNITLPLPGKPALNNGKYKLSYWKKINGEWNLIIDNNINITNGTYTVMLTGQIDDVCFLPLNAQMLTYTYNVDGNVTSTTDIKNFSVYYEYDTFQRLKFLKDQKGNIIKAINYNYRP